MAAQWRRRWYRLRLKVGRRLIRLGYNVRGETFTPPRPLTADERTRFERAFSSGGAGLSRQCECGRIFYNSDGGWDWERGELERLQANPKATDLPWAVGTVSIYGGEYVPDCDCWIEHAARIVAWLRTYRVEVADFYEAELAAKRAATQDAERTTSKMREQAHDEGGI
jgi:hypothetical protein